MKQNIMTQKIEIKTKICLKCKKEKPLSEFYKHETSKDGYRGYCKDCHYKKIKENRYINKKINKYRDYKNELLSGKTKICSRCKKEKPLGMFYEDKSKKDGYRSYCIECNKDYNRAYYYKNKERYKENRKAYYLKNKERLNKLSKAYRKKNAEKIRKAKLKIINKHKKLINRYKTFKGCKICGIKDSVILQFHHINSNDKKIKISELIGLHLTMKTFKKKLKEELRKCIIICANCHLKLHNNNQNNKLISND